MALSAEEKARCLYYLGYSIFEDDGPAIRALNGIDARPDAEPIIRADLEELVAIDAQLRKVRQVALGVQTGSTLVRPHYSLGVLRSQGRQVVGRIASFLYVTVKRDVFAEGAPGTVEGPDPTGRAADYLPSGGHGGCS